VIRGPPDCPPNRCDSQQDSRHATLEDASNAPLKNINQKKKNRHKKINQSNTKNKLYCRDSQKDQDSSSENGSYANASLENINNEKNTQTQKSEPVKHQKI